MDLSPCQIRYRVVVAIIVRGRKEFRARKIPIVFGSVLLIGYVLLRKRPRNILGGIAGVVTSIIYLPSDVRYGQDQKMIILYSTMLVKQG